MLELDEVAARVGELARKVDGGALELVKVAVMCFIDGRRRVGRVGFVRGVVRRWVARG